MNAVQYIKRPGKPAMAVLVVRVNVKRRASIARGLQKAGRPEWLIRHLTGLSKTGLARALAPVPQGLWGALIQEAA